MIFFSCEWALYLVFISGFGCLFEFQTRKEVFYYYFIFCKFSTPASADGLSLESELQQVSSAFQDSSQYSDQCYDVNGLDFFSDFQLFQSPFQAIGDCSKHTIIFGITVIFMFHRFLSSLARSNYLPLFLLSLIFTLGSARSAKSTRWQFLFFISFFFFSIINRSGLLVGIRWSVCISKSLKILCISFSRTDFGLYIYYLVVWSNFTILQNSQWITFPPSRFCLILPLR